MTDKINNLLDRVIGACTPDDMVALAIALLDQADVAVDAQEQIKAIAAASIKVRQDRRDYFAR